MKYLKLFNQHSEYNTYINGSDKILPNVSHCENENEMHYNPWVETRIVATFNVTSTSEATMICYSNSTTTFSEIEVDGVIQSSVVSNYTFSTTGEHTVKYTLVDPTTFGWAFAECSNLTSITIPSSVTSLDEAFYECSSLTSVIIPDSVTTIGDWTFYQCTSLTSIIIPNSVITIGNYAFDGCTGLTSVTIGNNVTSIGNYAFQDCSSLTNITIPNSVITIGSCTFYYCTGLTSITIGNSVTSIDNYAFRNCSGLISITSLATTASTIQSSTFQSVNTGGTLTVPSGSTGYDTWMGTGDYYLGKYNWTKVEQ